MNTDIIIGAAGGDSAISAIYQWGLAVITSIQAWGAPLDGFMRGISAFGTEAAYLVLILLIFWRIDEKQGVRLGIMLLFSAWINILLKELFHQPRPFQLDPSVGKLFEPTYGIPSGHAQNSLVFWMVAVWRTQRKRFFIAAIFMSFLIGISRLYLGVHFPTDLFAGWFFGAVILVGYALLEKRVSRFLAKSGLRIQLIVSAAVSFMMLLTGNILYSSAILGVGAGYALMLKFVHFSAKPKRG